MHIILDTDSSNPEYRGDCDYAVVELTSALVEQIRRRVELARQIGQQDEDLYELYFWGSTAAFFSHRLIDVCEEALASAGTADADQAVRNWQAKLDQNGHALLPPGVDLDAREPERTECDQFILRCSPSSRNPEFEIAWTASPKHSDVYVTTHDLPLTALESYLDDRGEVSA